MMKKPCLVLCLLLLFVGNSPETYSRCPQPQDSMGDGWSRGQFDELEGLTVGIVYFTGNENTRDMTIRRRLLFTEGDVFKLGLLRRSIARINRLGLFEKVAEQDVEWRVDSESKVVHFNFMFKERPRRKK